MRKSSNHLAFLLTSVFSRRKVNPFPLGKDLLVDSTNGAKTVPCALPPVIFMVHSRHDSAIVATSF